MTNAAFKPEVRKKLPTMVALRFLSNTGTRMVYTFLSPLAAGTGMSREAMSLVVGARDLTSLSAPALGLASDRSGYERVLRGGAYLTVAGLLLSVLGPVGVVFGFLLFGVGRAAYQLAMTTWIADNVAYERLGRATGFVEMAWGGSALIGIPIVGVLIDQVGWWAGFAVLAVLSAPLAVNIAIQHPGDGVAATGPRKRAALTVPVVLLLTAYAAMTLASQFLVIGQALWLEDDYGFDPAKVGFAVLTFGAVEVCATFTLAHISDRLGKRNAMVGGIAIMSVGMLALAAVGTPPLSVVLGLIVMTTFGFEFGVVSCSPLITELDLTARASMIGYSVAVATVVRAAGSVLATIVYQSQGFSFLIAIGAGCGFVAVVVGLFGVREP